MAKYHLVHGSTKNIQEKGGFQLFDYVYDSNSKSSDIGFVENGQDANGPGIYAFCIQENSHKDCVKGATGYAGVGGFVHFMHVEGDEGARLDQQPSDYIPSHVWQDALERYVAMRHESESYSPEKLQNTLERLSEEQEVLSFEEFSAHLSAFSEHLTLSSYDTNGMVTVLDQMDTILEDYEYADPCLNVYEEAGGDNFEHFADKIMDQFDDCWGVISRIHDYCAVESISAGFKSFNKTFAEALVSACENENIELIGALVNDAVYVVFDPTHISIDKVIQVKPSPEFEPSYPHKN